MYSKGLNNCYILLSNISQAFENTKFGAGELSLIVSLVLYLSLIHIYSTFEFLQIMFLFR